MTMISITSRISRLPLLLSAFLLALGFLGCSDAPNSAKGGKYHCPMHPTYVADRPGDCPICNMKLVPIKDVQAGVSKSGQNPPRPAVTTNATDYYCPMCPEVSSNVPGLCPECNMKLIPRQSEGMAAEPSVPGRVMIQVSPERRQTIGLTLAKVEKRNLSSTIRTTAVVEHDETMYVRVAPRFSGWIKKLHANYEGAPIEKGSPLFSAYSPELFAAQNEYLVALRASQSTGATNTIRTKPHFTALPPLLQSARMRLELLELPEEQIRSLEERGTPSPEMVFSAPISGHVLRRNVLQGQAFDSGQTLLEIADLSRVWLRAALYEYELPLVNVGQTATVHFPNIGVSAQAQVSFIYPHIDPVTRRGEIRLELENPNHVYRPDMWANVEIDLAAGEKLAVPASAVIDTGTRYIAFAESDESHLQPREVNIGLKAGDLWEVRSGLREGEQVVSRALFLIDSESQLKSAIAGMLSPSEQVEGPVGTHPGDQAPISNTAPAAGAHQH